ncbi:MAG: hypothetical protein GY750_21030 [Lentisphaerae bacterium]|nr:hypothetical protein [Lentisphaerota bacterium]
MALKTTAEQLEELQGAISAVMAMQSYTLDGRTVTYANLANLEAREERLEKKLAKENGKRPRVSVGKMSRAFN